MSLKNKQGLTEEQFLARYDAGKYERPSVTVDMLIFTVTDEENQNYRKLPEKVLRLLLIKRGDHPYIGQWALPGGFVEMDESLDEAALRELQEETNIKNIYMEQLYTWGDIGRDPRTRLSVLHIWPWWTVPPLKSKQAMMLMMQMVYSFVQIVSGT